MKLTDLDPRWFAPPGRTQTGFTFLCPCCIGTPRSVRLAIPLARPRDGGDPVPMGFRLVRECHARAEPVPFDVPAEFLWAHSGDGFANLTLAPSVDASASGHWHGWVCSGEAR
jgi:hypothetical protein